jgi:hypothetical protein
MKKDILKITKKTDNNKQDQAQEKNDKTKTL